jgi:hypothetical protein
MAERKLLRLDWEKELPKAEKPQYDPAKQVEGYQKRIAGAGQDPEAAVDTRNFVEKALNLTENQNALFDVFEIINRPQQAIFGGIEAAQKGTSVGEGIMKGLTGETDIRATELLQNAGFQKNLGTDAVGFLLDVFADPVDLALIPVTGGLSLAANLTDGAADAAKAIKVIGKYSDEAAEIAFDVVQKNAKGLKVKFSNLDEFKTVLKKYDIGADEYLLNLAKSVKQFVSPIDVTFGAVGKGFKAGLNGADSLITSTLKFVDDAIPTVPKLADEARGLVKELTRVDRYTNFKKSISNIISYVGALPQRLKFKSKLAQGGAELTANKLVYVEKEVIQQLDNYVAKQIKFNPLYKGLNVESARVLAGKQLQLKAEIAGKFDPQTTIESFLEKGNARVPRDVDTNVKADLINFFEDMLPDVYDRKTLERMFEKTPTQDNMFFINEDQWAGLIDEYKKAYNRLPADEAAYDIQQTAVRAKEKQIRTKKYGGFDPYESNVHIENRTTGGSVFKYEPNTSPDFIPNEYRLPDNYLIGGKYKNITDALNNVKTNNIVYLGEATDAAIIPLIEKGGISVKNGKIIDATKTTTGFNLAIDKKSEQYFKSIKDVLLEINRKNPTDYGVWFDDYANQWVLDLSSRYFDDAEVANDIAFFAQQNSIAAYTKNGLDFPNPKAPKGSVNLTELTKNEIKTIEETVKNANLTDEVAIKELRKKLTQDQQKIALKRNLRKEFTQKDFVLYHGSESDFNKFETKYFNKGTGDSVGGGGLYFSKREDVANEYAEKLYTVRTNLKNVVLDEDGGFLPVIKNLEEFAKKYGEEITPQHLSYMEGKLKSFYAAMPYLENLATKNKVNFNKIMNDLNIDGFIRNKGNEVIIFNEDVIEIVSKIDNPKGRRMFSKKKFAEESRVKNIVEDVARDFGEKTDILGIRPVDTRYVKRGRRPETQDLVNKITKEKLTAPRYFTQGEYERISRLAEDPDFVALEKSIDDLYRDAANIMDEHGLKFRGEMYDRGIIPHARTVEYDEFGELPSKIASDYNRVKGNSKAFGAREFNMSATEANLVSEQRILRLKEKGLLSDEMLKVMDEKGIPKLFAEDMQRSLSELIIKGPELQKNVEMLSELVMKDALSDDLLLKSAIPDEFGRIKEPPGFKLITKAQLEKQIKGLGKYMAGDGPMQKAIEVLADKGDNLLIDARVANLIMTISDPKTANILLDVIDKSNNLFKTGKLMTPGLLMRNFGGNVTNVVLSGVPINVVLKERVYAMEVLNKGQELLEASVRKTRILTSQETDMLKLYQEFIENGFNKMSYDRIDIPPIMRDILNKPLNQRSKWEQAVGFFAEKNVQDDLIHRMGAYIIAKKNPKYYLSLGITNPADYVRSVLFDPNDLSRFEQNVLKRIIPFYTWTKQNLVYQMKNFSRRPGAYYRTAKMFDGAWELKGIDPTTDIEDYKRENFWLPVPVLGKNGKYYAVKMNLPLADLGEFTSNPLGRVLSATAPVIRAPFEIATNTQVMTGLPVQDFKGQAGYSIPGMPRNIEYGLGQLGLDVPLGAGVRTAQAIGGLATGEMGLTEAAENTILKSIVSPGDVARTQRSRAYDKLNKVRETMKFFKQEGIEIPTIAELENKAKQNMYNRIKGQLAKYK